MKSLRFDDSVALVADEGQVWARVSELEKMPLYWAHMTSLKVVRNDGPTFYGEISFSNEGTGTATIIVNDTERTLLIYYTGGSLLGTHRIWVKRGVLETLWDVRSGSPDSVDLGSLRLVTKEALAKLAGISLL